MRDLVQMVLEIIENEKLIPYVKHILEDETDSPFEKICGLPTKYSKLICLVPQVIMLDSISFNQLLLYLQNRYSLNIKICQFFNIVNNEQYCSFFGQPERCRCLILFNQKKCLHLARRN